MSREDEASKAAEAQEAEPRQTEAQANDAQAAPEQQEPGADEAEINPELEQAEAKAADYWDRLVRTRAEMENIRKRAERDVDHARKYALEKFAGDLLSVRDSLEMGIASAREEGGADKHVEGMELTLKMLSGTMEKFGVEEMNPQGEAFNPEYHEAMSMQESAEAQPNTVLQVMQKGYLLNERVLRPAMVVVSRAPS